jgi:hypothetical protein
MELLLAVDHETSTHCAMGGLNNTIRVIQRRAFGLKMELRFTFHVKTYNTAPEHL